MPENNQLLSVEGQLVGIPVQEYTAGPGIVVDNVNKVVSTKDNNWIDVKSEVNYNTNAIQSGSFSIYYNPFLKMVWVSCDVQIKAGQYNIMTWTDRLKPPKACSLGNSLYLSETYLFQPSGATLRWVNGSWVWPVAGGN
jgi:hypothetical protein